MSGSSLRRFLTVAASTVALGVTVAAPAPALAGSMFFAKSSGTIASTSWLEVGELPPEANAPGNAHFGELWVEDLGNGRSSVFGTVYDVQCDDGVTPYNPGGGHGEEPPAEGPCELLGLRFMDGGQLTFTIDRKLTRATLTGTLAVGSGHGEGPVGTPPVNITWIGVGDAFTSREAGSGTDEYGTFRYRYTFTGRDATIAAGSRIGPMVFDDEPGEYSEAQIGKYRSSDRSRS
jgi:hypothetical protein